MDINDLKSLLEIELSSLIIAWFYIISGLIVKDILSSVSFGIMFYFDSNFQEGDKIKLNNEEVIIQKIGITTSIFKNLKTGDWQYIKNDKIKNNKLEKSPENNK